MTFEKNLELARSTRQACPALQEIAILASCITFYEPFGCIHATLGWPGIDLPSIYDEQWEIIPFDKVPGAIQHENALVIAGRNRGNSDE